jgi:hypothetical protein
MKPDEIAHMGAPDAIRCVPVPCWVEHDAYLSQMPEANDACVANGVCRLLQDIQVDLTGSEFAWHFWTAQRVLTRAGAERIAQFGAEFDPAFQRLEVHFVRILRGQECIEHAKPGAFQLLRRETTLERLTLNGRLTASLVIPDLRVDDILEIGLTLYGNNPVLDGKYAGWMALDPFHPWWESRHRLMRPLARDIAIKQFNDPPERKIAVQDGVEVSRWHIVGQKRREFETLTPPWLVLAPALQLSEFKSWIDVARLFAPSYESGDIPDTLTSEIDRLAATYADPADRAAEWLRFVQRELRYFALALGEGGLLPRALQTIWMSRFGDCKDAARLYIAGARRMGLDVCAALVSTTHGPALDDFLPSPNVFNHCIVRLRLNDATYWLDPTLQTQSGSLANIYQGCAGWALPLTPEATQLESLGSTKSLHVLDCSDELRFGPKRTSPVRLRRQVEHRSWVADSIRNRIANEGTAEYAKGILKDVEAIWPNVVETEPVKISDDRTENHFVATFAYEIRDGWKPDKSGKRIGFAVVDPVIGKELNPLGNAERHAEIFLGRPRKVTSRVAMQMPWRWSGSGWDQKYRERGLSFTSRLTIKAKTIRCAKELVIEAWSMPAGEADAYRTVANKIRENLVTIGASEWFGRLRPARWWRQILGFVWLFVVLVYIFYILVLGANLATTPFR